MTPEFIMQLIANVPNFAGFVILAWVLNKSNGELRDQYNKLLDRYHELVETLLSKQVISSQDARQLRK